MQNNQTERVISDKIRPIGEENIFRDDNYFQWCSSVIRTDDGLYHLCYSKWRRELTFDGGWLTHSIIAYAVSEKPYGPYRYVGTLLDFEKDSYEPGEKITAHNPKLKYFDGKYYLYFCSTHSDRKISNDEMIETARVAYTHPNWKMLRTNQRTFVAVSDSLDKPFKVSETPLIEPSGPITTLTVNPAITKGKDSRYYLIVKGDKPNTDKFERNQAIAVSDYPDRGFVMQEKPVIQDWDTEDVSMWYDRHTDRYYAVFHAHTYIGMMVSKNGIDWEKAEDFVLTKKKIELRGGGAIVAERLERPFVYAEDGEPVCLSLAVNESNDAYIIFIPLKD